MIYLKRKGEMEMFLLNVYTYLISLTVHDSFRLRLLNAVLT